MPRRVALPLLAALLLAVAWVQVRYLQAFPYPPHSSHDGFLLIPQVQKALLGYAPQDPGFAVYAPTVFHGPAEGGLLENLRELAPRLVWNELPHHWIELPHSLFLAGLAAAVWPGSLLAPGLVFTGYLLLTLVALYGIGAELADRRAGLLAAAIGAGCPGLFGAARYLEGHLPTAAMTALCVWALVRSDGLRRPGASLAAGLTAWGAARAGEGAAEAVGAGVALAAPALATGLAALWGIARGPGRAWRGLGIALALGSVGLLMDGAWVQVCAERALSGFADPVVQADAAADPAAADTAAHLWGWAYLVLTGTDYMKPALALAWLPALPGLIWGAARGRFRWRLGVIVWLLAPLYAYSIMHRKASWYGLPLVPAEVIWVALGLWSIPWGWPRRLLSGAAALIALGQLVAFSEIPREAMSDAARWWRDPLPISEWRLRRLALLRPVDQAEILATQRDALALLDALPPPDPGGGLTHAAALTMAYAHDYPLRYLLEIGRPDLHVIPLADPRLRQSRYRGLHPDDADLLIFAPEGLAAWPPDAEQRRWLYQNVHCRPPDPLTPFLGAILERADLERAGDVAPPPRYWLEPRADRGRPGRTWAVLEQGHVAERWVPAVGHRICAPDPTRDGPDAAPALEAPQ